MAQLKTRGRLFRKYTILFVGLVGGSLLASGAVETYFSYQENKAMLLGIQREKATAAAAVIRQFVREIENQITWTMHSSFLPDDQQFDQQRVDFRPCTTPKLGTLYGDQACHYRPDALH